MQTSFYTQPKKKTQIYKQLQQTENIANFFLVWFINHTKRDLALEALRLAKKENLPRRDVFIMRY